MPGTLYIVATPLGNLEDLPPRALRILRDVHRVACEDTRRTSALLRRFGIDTPTLSCHKFNERSRLESVLRLLREGHDVALVSDGGTPGVSDPGARLVRAALEDEVRVSPVPGASAAVALISASGVSGDRFLFEGFLPHRAGERRRRLRELRDLRCAVVAFDSPRRLRGTLRDLEEVLGDRTVVIGRELTKIHETILRGSPRDLLDRLGDGDIRGEVALVIAPGDPASPVHEADAERIRSAWSEAVSASSGDRREALRRAARQLGLKRAELQRRLAELGLAAGRRQV